MVEINTFVKMIIPSIIIIGIYFIFNLFRSGTIPSFAFINQDFMFYMVICTLLLYSILFSNKNRLFNNSGDDYQIIEDQFERFNEYYKSATGTKSDLKKLVSRIERKDFISNDKTRIIDCMEILFKTDNGYYLIIYDITNHKIRRGMSTPDTWYKQIPFYEFDIENYRHRPYDYQRKDSQIVIDQRKNSSKDMDNEALGKKTEDKDGEKDKAQ